MTTTVHGTLTAYTRDKCRCEPCRTHTNRHTKRVRILGTTLTSADPVRDHITALFAAGWTRNSIADASGIGQRHVSQIHANPTKYRRVHQRVADAILPLPLSLEQAGQLPSPIGVQRRLQALCAIGYTQRELAAALGTQQGYLNRMLHRTPKATTTRRVAQAVRDTYQRLHLTPGTNQQSIASAQRHGWLPPLAWDDIDNPAEHPVRVTRGNGTHLKLSDTEVVELVTDGMTFDALALRLDIDPKSVERRYYRALRNLERMAV